MTSQRILETAGDQPSHGVRKALERIYESGQTLLIRRIDLLVEEARMLVQDTVLRIAGGVIVLLGWIRVMNGMVDGLARVMPQHWAEVSVGALHVALGVGCFLWARTQSRKLATR